MSWKGWNYGNNWKGWGGDWRKHNWGNDWPGAKTKEQKRAEREHALALQVAAIQYEFSQAPPSQSFMLRQPPTYAQVAAAPATPPQAQMSQPSADTPFDSSQQGIEERRHRALLIQRLVRARDALEKGDPERTSVEARIENARAESRGS